MDALLRVTTEDRDDFLDANHFVELVTPVQWADGRISRELPERAFLRVVLASGLHELANYPPGSEQHDAAMTWLLEDEDMRNVCSFRVLCDVFDLDPSAVRRSVLARLDAGTLFITREARVPDARPKTLHAKKAA